MPVAVEVADGDPHSGESFAVFVKGSSPQDGLVAEGPVPLIHVQNRRGPVAGDIYVRPPVSVEVSGDSAQRVVAARGSDAARVRRVAEPARALVPEELVAREREAAGSACNRHVAVEAVRVRPGLGHGSGIEDEIVGDEDFQVAVLVDIQERTARAVPVAVGNRHAFEAGSADIAVQPIGPPVGDEQIRPAVVVEIARADSLSPALAAQARGSGHVLETPATEVAVQAVRAAVPRDKERVGQAVSVIVEEGRAAAGGLEYPALLPVASVGHCGSQAGLCGRVHIVHGLAVQQACSGQRHKRRDAFGDWHLQGASPMRRRNSLNSPSCGACRRSSASWMRRASSLRPALRYASIRL